MDIENYATKDIHLAAFLFSEGIQFTGLKQEADHYLFLFENIDKCCELERLFWMGRTVNVISFINSLKTLKNLLFLQKGR